jgi:hypothetical protein
MTRGEGQLTQSKEHVTQGEGHMTQSEEHVIRGEKQVARSVHNQKGNWLTRAG